VTTPTTPLPTPKPDVARFAAKHGYFVLIDANGDISDKNEYGKLLDFAFRRLSTARSWADRRGVFVLTPDGKVIR
jgi:hypothetical protein